MVPSDIEFPNRPTGPERTLHERQEAHPRTDHRQAVRPGMPSQRRGHHWPRLPEARHQRTDLPSPRAGMAAWKADAASSFSRNSSRRISGCKRAGWRSTSRSSARKRWTTWERQAFAETPGGRTCGRWAKKCPSEGPAKYWGSRAFQRYVAQRDDDEPALVRRMLELVARHPRFGYRRMLGVTQAGRLACE